jgi:uncharacterized Zn finger protein (UPF0148 family)
MSCEHPTAFITIKNGQRVCGICGATVEEFTAMNPPEPAEVEEAPKPKRTRRKKADAE